MGLLSKAAKKIKKLHSSVIDKSKLSVALSLRAAKATVSGSIDTHKRLARGDIKGAFQAKIAQHKSSLRDTFKSGAEAASAANEIRIVNHEIVTPGAVKKIERKAVDEFNRFMGSDAGQVLGYVLKCIPLTAPYAWAYEAASLVAVAEQVRSMLSQVKNMQERAKLNATLEAKKYVYDDEVQAVRLSKEGDAEDMPIYRYVAAREGFLPIKKSNAGGLLTVGLIALGSIA